MHPGRLFDLYENCLSPLELVPEGHHHAIMEIAERLLDCVEEIQDREQNAPTSRTLQ